MTFAATSQVQAQRNEAFKFENRPHHDQKPYHFGFSLGFNKMDFSLKPIPNLHKVEMSPEDFIVTAEFDTLHSVRTRAENGFNIGIVSNLRLSDHFDLRFIPTLTFGDRNIIYKGIKDEKSITRTQPLESTFIDFPLHIKYKSVRMLNTRAYVIGGLKYSHDLASTEDKEDFDEEILARIGKNDYFYELGVGFDYYFYYFKFSTEIKASFGFSDMLTRENSMFTNSIERLNSKIIMISFLFE
ncbi:MAG: outer membrane beta-barrel protein [bacterium]